MKVKVTRTGAFDDIISIEAPQIEVVPSPGWVHVYCYDAGGECTKMTLFSQQCVAMIERVPS